MTTPKAESNSEPAKAAPVDMYQTVTLVLADGTRCKFVGRYSIPENIAVKVVGIDVSRPRPLPPGHRFEDMG